MGGYHLYLVNSSIIFCLKLFKAGKNFEVNYPVRLRLKDKLSGNDPCLEMALIANDL